jgi:hypothetical protein
MDVTDIRNNYFLLVDKVEHAIRTQMGDAQRLGQQRDDVLAFRMSLSHPHVSTPVSAGLVGSLILAGHRLVTGRV